MHSLKDGGEPGGGWAAGARDLFLALLLCDAGQAMEASVPLGSVSSQHSASQIPPWARPAASLCLDDMPGWGGNPEISTYTSQREDTRDAGGLSERIVFAGR